MFEMSEESRDIRESTYFNELEWTAFKASCEEAGIARSVVLRSLALRWVKEQHRAMIANRAGLGEPPDNTLSDP